MDSFLIGVAIVVALYVAVRLVLRHYFRPIPDQCIGGTGLAHAQGTFPNPACFGEGEPCIRLPSGEGQRWIVRQ
jgi:hypothetical protein